ncbi:MAG TPA: DsbA family oxidoreductase [Solirubrobacteraceae bacterium]|nr:DsbA family oxidoreductase [Solirubrobacteraceae bacterium]
MAPLALEIWSDVVCPWCYVGKRRLEAALAMLPDRDDVEVRWRSFQLDPEAPPARDVPADEHLAAKYGMSVEDARALNEQMTELAAGEGLEYHLDRTRGGNTFDAHRLIQLGAARGVQDAVKERLMRGYFTEGEAVSDHETLVRLGADAGLDPDEARAVLESGAYADDVRADEDLARRMGIRGVPYFVLDRRFGVSGAQPAELLVQAFERARQEAA